MANANRAEGFKPWGRILRATPYTAGGTVYPGDAVKLNSAGQVVVAAAGDALLGVSLEYVTSGNRFMVCDDPEQHYAIQATGSSVAAQTNLNNTADIVVNSADTTYKMSRTELDDSTLSSSSAKQCLLIDLVQAPDNAFGSKAKVVVKINKHQAVDSFTGV